MARQSETRMPEDWNDHAEWDHYFRDRLNRGAV